MSGFKTRFWTALLFVVIMLCGITINEYSFLLLFGVINFLCIWEFFGLVLGKNLKESLFRNLVALFMGISPFFFSGALQLGWVPNDPDFLMIVFIVYIVFFYLTFVIELFNTSTHALQFLAYVVLGIIYIGGSFSILNSFAFVNGQYLYYLVLGPVLFTWINDTAAYLVGSKFGKTPLFPRISPKKSWEGTFGAALITLIMAYPISLLMPQLSYSTWLGMATVIFITGGIGDLVESMFKRSINIKDSSGLLPGHGGFLDRFDAFIFSVPFVAAYLFLTDII